MYEICPKVKCTGCGACMSSCRHRAITMHNDVYGFTYPIIDEEKCVDCKLCIKNCHVINSPTVKGPTNCYACYNIDKISRGQSSSGGLASLLAQSFIEKGGITYGCAFTPPFFVEHVRCSTKNELLRLKGSKYVQSEMAGVFHNIEDDLMRGRLVLFIGTPCQSAAVKTRFKSAGNLYVVDLVCHGVPSLQFLKDTLPESLICVAKDTMEFRASTKYHFSLRNGISTIYERPLRDDLFMKGFFTGVTFRTSCFTCRYAQRQRATDLTIGDFWGLKSKTIQEDGKGISLCLVNTEKGQTMFDSVRNQMVVEERPVDEGIAGNQQLNHPFKGTLREKIFKMLYPHIGFTLSLWSALPDKLFATKLKKLFR